MREWDVGVHRVELQVCPGTCFGTILMASCQGQGFLVRVVTVSTGVVLLGEEGMLALWAELLKVWHRRVPLVDRRVPVLVQNVQVCFLLQEVLLSIRFPQFQLQRDLKRELRLTWRCCECLAEVCDSEVVCRAVEKLAARTNFIFFWSCEDDCECWRISSIFWKCWRNSTGFSYWYSECQWAYCNRRKWK